MRFRLLLTFLILLLSACGGGQPNETPELPTLVGEQSTSASVIDDSANALTALPQGTNDLPPTPRPTVEGELVPGDPRTLVASKTEDPDANIPFALIRLARTGGPSTGSTPEPLIIEISGDGRVTRNGIEGQIDQATIDNLNALIREMNFFGASGDYLGAIPLDGTEDYFYIITVQRGDLSRSIQARDGNIPQELKNIIAAVLQQGNRA